LDRLAPWLRERYDRFKVLLRWVDLRFVEPTDLGRPVAGRFVAGRFAAGRFAAGRWVVGCLVIFPQPPWP
jgi:hypothetical protein